MTIPSTSITAQGAPAPWAAFVFAPAGGRGWAATTRAADRGEAGRIGLPGGKVDAGERPWAAALRESAEEGWRVTGPLRPVHEAPVDGRVVVWLLASEAIPLASYTEAHRGIRPVGLTLAEIEASGYGNDGAVAALRRLLNPWGGEDAFAAPAWGRGR